MDCIYKIQLLLCLITMLVNIWLDKCYWTVFNQMILGQNAVTIR